MTSSVDARPLGDLWTMQLAADCDQRWQCGVCGEWWPIDAMGYCYGCHRERCDLCRFTHVGCGS